MAHNIENRNGKNSIVYTGETPWHKLGQKLAEPFTAEDALRRTDTKYILGICADIYKPLQNREAFGFFDALFGKDKARYEVAGVLGKGEKVWMLAKLPGDFSATESVAPMMSGRGLEIKQRAFTFAQDMALAPTN